MTDSKKKDTQGEDTKVSQETTENTPVKKKRPARRKRKKTSTPGAERLSADKQPPVKKVTDKDSPSKDSPSKDSPSKDSPSKDSPSKDSPSKDSPSKDSPSKDSPSKDSPSKDSPSKDSPSKDSAKPNINIKSEDHMLPGINDLDAYIAKTKVHTKQEKKQLTEEELTAKDGTSLRKIPGLYALIPHAKGDHKLVYLEKDLPVGAVDDPKKRVPGEMYTKNNQAIYKVVVSMKEHPSLTNNRGKPYDIWVISDPKQLDEQIQAIKEGMGGGENFQQPILIEATGSSSTNQDDDSLSLDIDVDTIDIDDKDLEVVDDILNKEISPEKQENTKISEEILLSDKVDQEHDEDNDNQGEDEEVGPIVDLSLDDEKEAEEETPQDNDKEQNKDKDTDEKDQEPKKQETDELVKEEDSESDNEDDLTGMDQPSGMFRQPAIDPSPESSYEEELLNNEETAQEESEEDTQEDISEENKKQPEEISSKKVDDAATLGDISQVEQIKSKESADSQDDPPSDSSSDLETTSSSLDTSETGSLDLDALHIESSSNDDGVDLDSIDTSSSASDAQQQKTSEKQENTKEKKKKGTFPIGLVVRIVLLVIVLSSLFLVWKVMFPKIQGTKPTDDMTIGEQPVVDTIIDDNDDNNDNQQDLPDEDIVPAPPTFPVDDILSLGELREILEAQQIEARKINNIAKLLENKDAIKFSLAALLRAGHVLDRIENDTTITADDVSAETEKIDLYLSEANKLIE